MTVAHHKRHAAQILRAVYWGIPLVVLVREPTDTVNSLLAVAEENRERKGRTGHYNAVTFFDVARAWLCFYEAACRPENKVVIAGFKDVTRDLVGIIAEVNMRYGTTFRTGPLLRIEEPTDFGWHALPNEIRASIKSGLCDRLKEESRRGRLHDVLRRCGNIYQALTVPR